MIVIMASGARIRIIPGEGFGDDCFAGELLNPTEKERRGGAHWSSLWLRSKIVALEGGDLATAEF